VKYSLVCIFALMLLMACKPTVPKQYIQPDDMEEILYDFHVAQSMSRVVEPKDASINREVYVDAVLRKHGVTQAEFDTSLVYYYSRADRMKDIYAHVSERLNDEATQLGAGGSELNRYSQYSSTGDTANIWNDASSVLLIPRATQNRFNFTVKVDTSFYRGDSFMFQFMTEYLYQSGAKDAVVCIMTKYEGDSIIQTTSHVTVPGLAQVRIPANNKNKLKEMRGFIYLTDGGDPSDTRKMMFVSQMQLIRFHSKIKWEEYDREQKDSVETDSLQRVDNTGRAVPDTLRRRVVGRRPGGTPLQPQQGAATHRVVARPAELETRR